MDQLVKIIEKVYFIFFELSPFADLDFENLYSCFLKNYNSLELQTWSADRG